MKLVVGLGNPGRRYASTRHNAGFRIVDRFVEAHGIAPMRRRFRGRFGQGRVGGVGTPAVDVGVLKPETFLNRSGEALAAALEELPVGDPSEDVLVAVDDVDLPFGRLRIRPSGGSAGHRGLESVIECLETRDFPRLRFGVDRPPDGMDTAAYVLEDFSPREVATLDAQLDAAVRALDAMLLEGVVTAMNRYNRDSP